jgi:tetratricopeptide (TPR) repeat protein
MYYTEDLVQAELHLKMAIKFEVTFTPAYLHLGTLYVRQARYTDAIECSQAGLTKSNAKRLGLLQNLAQAYELRKDWGLAIKAYKEAMIGSVAEYEVSTLMAGIKRCRKKRAAVFFGL